MAERIRVFIDGQNLFKGLWRKHRHRVHPVLLSRQLAGDREVAGIHYYSGLHARVENPANYDMVRRRHELMERTGVVVTERTLHYHWEWRVDDDLPPPWRDDVEDPLEATVRRHRRAREKGIDVALALDAVASATEHDCDVIVIVSRDRDLMEIATELHERTSDEPVRVEVAFVSGDRGDELPLPGYDGHHFIDAALAAACADTFDYRHDLPDDDVKAFLDSL